MMTRLVGMSGGVILGGKMSCSRCYQEVMSWELRTVGFAVGLQEEQSVSETVCQLMSVMLANVTACSLCAEVDKATRLAELDSADSGS